MTFLSNQDIELKLRWSNADPAKAQPKSSADLEPL